MKVLDTIFALIDHFAKVLLILALVALALSIGVQIGREPQIPLYEKIITVQGELVEAWKGRAEDMRVKLGDMEYDQWVQAGKEKKGRKGP